MASKRSLIIISLVVVVIIAAIVGYYLSLPSPTQETIKIGFFAPLTGPASADGLAALNGALLAVEKINSQGGILNKKVELVYYDDQLKPDQAVAIANKLIQQDKVVAVVSGSYSSTTLAASSIYEENKIPLVVAYAVHPGITANKTYVFRVGMLGETEGKAAGWAAVNVFKAKKVAILYDNIPFGISLAENAKAIIEKSNATVVYYEKFDDPTRDFTPWLTAIANIKDLDVLIIFGYYYHAQVVKQARQLGITAQILGAEGFDSPKFIELAGSDAEGVVIVTDFNRDNPSSDVKNFISAYKNKANIDADMVAASSYDAVMVLAKAIQNAGSTNSNKIIQALSTLENYDGIAGKILRFTQGHNAVKIMTLQVVRNGKFSFYAEISEPSIITPSR